jgi:ribonuclease HI
MGFKAMGSIKSPVRKFVVLNPWLHPSDVFVPQVNDYRAARYISVMNPQQVLLYVGGACYDYGKGGTRAAWSLVFRPDAPDANVTCRLERDGPQTQQRAELRGVIAALQYRAWNSEGFRSIVIATNSEYVIHGATEWAWKWDKNGWKNPNEGVPVPNRSLWEKLMKEVKKLESIGVEPKFWHVSPEWNEAAIDLAMEGTKREDVDSSFQKVVGILV